MNNKQFMTTGYMLLNLYGTVIGVYPDMKTLMANHPYSDGYEPKQPEYRIEEVRIFTDTAHNKTIQGIIHRAKSDRSGRICRMEDL